MDTGVIVAIVIIAVLVIAALVLLPKMRASSQTRGRERDFSSGVTRS